MKRGLKELGGVVVVAHMLCLYLDEKRIESPSHSPHSSEFSSKQLDEKRIES